MSHCTDAADSAANGRSHQPDQSPPTTALPVTFLVLLGIDVVVDGLLLGVGFSAGAKEGKPLAYALGIESISLDLATAATFYVGFLLFLLLGMLV